jgi:hypothetical protein
MYKTDDYITSVYVRRMSDASMNAQDKENNIIKKYLIYN